MDIGSIWKIWDSKIKVIVSHVTSRASRLVCFVIVKSKKVTWNYRTRKRLRKGLTKVFVNDILKLRS